MAKRRKITKADVRAAAMRWARVNDYERKELRKTPVEEKLRQLAALMLSCDGLGYTKALDGEQHIARERWRDLRRAYGL
jgi:hypothetical protein